MKPKKYEEVSYIAVKNSTQKDFKRLSIFSIGMTIIASIICLACMKLGIENEALKQENEELRNLIEMRVDN